MMVEWSEPAWSQTLNKIYTPSEKVLIYPGYLLSESKRIACTHSANVRGKANEGSRLHPIRFA